MDARKRKKSADNGRKAQLSPPCPSEENYSVKKSESSTSFEDKIETTKSVQSLALEFPPSGDSSVSSMCYKDDFYDVPCKQLALSLLGKILVRRLGCGYTLKGRIVETECYLGYEDKASHSFLGKMTERNSPMFMKPGTSYVYFTYGMYYCFNISSQGPGAAVLIRALEPLEGLEVMSELRMRGPKKKRQKSADGDGDTRKPLRPHELCNGPSKLCIAMDIDQESCNKRDLSCWPGLAVLRDAEVSDDAVVVTKRVGIESAGPEWADKPLRFYLLGNPAVSKRDRARERELETKRAAQSGHQLENA